MWEGIFLQVHHGNVSDLHFTSKDVAYIVGLCVTILGSWFKMKFDNDKQNTKIKILETRADQYYKECKEEFTNAKNGRVSIRRDFDANIISNNLAFSARLDKIDKEVKEMNVTINKVNNNLTEVKAKLDVVINRP